MKKQFKFIALSMVAIFLVAGASSPTVAQTIDYPHGLTILNYEGNSFAPSATGFEANWTDADNTFMNETSYDFANLESDGIDVLLLPRTEGLDAAALTEIATWFATGGKVLWVGGDSDFGGNYIANDVANPLLTELGTALRMYAGSVEDPQSNDEAAYRVVTNSTGVSSDMTDYVTEGFERMVMHGPAAVLYEESGEVKDLRNATLDGALANVNIIINASAAAVASGLDSDTSITPEDLYAYSDVSGNYPMLVTDNVDDSMVVVSGESVFTDYKFMYGTADENGGDPHQGSDIVDRTISYYYQNVYTEYDDHADDADDDTTDNGGTPFGFFAGVLGISSIATLVLIRRKD